MPISSESAESRRWRLRCTACTHPVYTRRVLSLTARLRSSPSSGSASGGAAAEEAAAWAVALRVALRFDRVSRRSAVVTAAGVGRDRHCATAAWLGALLAMGAQTALGCEAGYAAAVNERELDGVLPLCPGGDTVAGTQADARDWSTATAFEAARPGWVE